MPSIDNWSLLNTLLLFQANGLGLFKCTVNSIFKAFSCLMGPIQQVPPLRPAQQEQVPEPE